MAGSTARRTFALVLGVAIAIGGGTFDFRGAEAKPRRHCPPWPLYQACALTLGFVTSIGAGLFGTGSMAARPRSACPPGQIYRGSKRTCVPKGAEAKLGAARNTIAELPLPPRREMLDEGTAAQNSDLARVDPAPTLDVPNGAEPTLEVGRNTSNAPPLPPRRDILEEASAPRSRERARVGRAPTHDKPTPIEAKAPQGLRADASTFDHKTAVETILRLGLARETATPQLEDLVVFCRMALKSYRRTEAPFAWAAVRNNLANALVALEERKNGTEGMEEAVALYREASTERTRENAPRDWATIQTNLGEALTLLGLRENAVPKLAEGAAVKREALIWAKHTGDEGVALMRLAEQLGDKDKARTALAQIDTALTTIQGGDHGSPLATYFEEQLPKARALVEQLSEPRAKEPHARDRVE